MTRTDLGLKIFRDEAFGLGLGSCAKTHRQIENAVIVVRILMAEKRFELMIIAIITIKNVVGSQMVSLCHADRYSNHTTEAVGGTV